MRGSGADAIQPISYWLVVVPHIIIFTMRSKLLSRTCPFTSYASSDIVRSGEALQNEDDQLQNGGKLQILHHRWGFRRRGSTGF